MKKRKIEVVVISDVHLGTPYSRAEELLLYLSSIKPGILVLNGDFTEAGKSRKYYFPESHIKVIEKVLSMQSEGTEVYYINGERDAFAKKIDGRFISKLRIQERLILNLDGKTTVILHGGILDTFPVLAKWFSRLGPLGYKAHYLINRIGRRNFKRQHKEVHSADPKLRSAFSTDQNGLSKFDRTAMDMALQHGYDTVICGYTHQPRKALVEDSKGQCLYLNSGDWVEHLTALEYSFKRWKLHSFKRDKLMAYYGDEAVRNRDIPELVEDFS